MTISQAGEHRSDVDPHAVLNGARATLGEVFPMDSWAIIEPSLPVHDDDLSESRWKQVSHLVQVWWSRIDNDEVAGIKGEASRLASLLQSRYGYTEYHANSQSVRWMRQHRDLWDVLG